MSDLSNSFTNDDLRGMITGNNPVSNAYRELLAYREAQGKAVGWKWRLVDMVSGETSEWRICLLPFSPGGGAGFETESIPLYAAPQLPDVPDIPKYERTEDFADYHEGWNACREYALNTASFRETDNSSTKHFRENTETSTKCPKCGGRETYHCPQANGTVECECTLAAASKHAPAWFGVDWAISPLSDLPEVLPCPVKLEPGLTLGKGVKTQTLLDALIRREKYYAELEAMTPEQRTEHEEGIASIKSMLTAPNSQKSET